MYSPSTDVFMPLCNAYNAQLFTDLARKGGLPAGTTDWGTTASTTTRLQGMPVLLVVPTCDSLIQKGEKILVLAVYIAISPQIIQGHNKVMNKLT